MNRKASRGSTPRGGARGGPARSGKRPLQQGKKTPGVAKKRAAAGAAPAAPSGPPTLPIGFVRGVALPFVGAAIAQFGPVHRLTQSRA